MSRPFVNWARTVRSHPTTWASPDSEAPVCDLIREVADRRGRLRVCGTRHSWSAIAAGDDVQVTLDRLRRVIRINPEARTITVQGGCRLADVNRALAARGLALPILGSIAEQTVAGALATGTHGSSLRHGNLATLATRIRLVDGRGEVHDLDATDPELLAARVHLGALGVITEVTLQAEPAFGLVETCVKLPLAEAAAQLAQLAADHEYIKCWWFPPCPEVAIYTLARAPLSRRRSRLARAWERTANAALFPALLSLTRLQPNWISRINHAVDRVHLRPGTRSGRSDEIFLLAVPPRHQETELAFPAPRAGPALLALRDMLAATGARLDFINELRFVRGDDAWMSPAHGRDTCQLGVYATHSPDTPRAFADYATLGESWDARPHWGKQFTTTPTAITRLYPRAGDFRELARAWDPASIFRNPVLDAILGPP